MARFLYHHFQREARRKSWFPLAFFFIMGLTSSGILYICADSSCFLSMDGLLSASISIVGLASVWFVPFLFSAFAVYFGHRWLLLPIAFGKAFSVTWIALCICRTYGSGAWVALSILMFSDWLSLPLLWMFWLSGYCAHRAPHWLCYLLLFLLIGCVDFFLIAPFAVMI